MRCCLPRLDRLCDEFDAAWQAGFPRIEDFLDRTGGESPELLLRYLLMTEIDYRLARGQCPSSAEYEPRFPQYRGLVQETVQARLCRRDDPPVIEETLVPRLLGDYEVFQKLGSGGMGEVYKARHRRLRRWVALKQLHPNSVGDADAQRRFAQEIEAIGRLNHPNLVLCTDAREESGVHFLVMEYIEGADLAAIVKRCGPVAVPAACEIVRQAAVGLQHVASRDGASRY